jgi:hypothetical protein
MTALRRIICKLLGLLLHPAGQEDYETFSSFSRIRFHRPDCPPITIIQPAFPIPPDFRKNVSLAGLLLATVIRIQYLHSQVCVYIFFKIFRSCLGKGIKI